MFRKIAVITLVLAVATPALAQNRFMDEAKANAMRRDENKAVRDAEHPEDASATKTAAVPAPATPAAPAAAAPAAPAAAPAAPAQPAPAAAPGTAAQ
jgi:hypothetical protein